MHMLQSHGITFQGWIIRMFAGTVTQTTSTFKSDDDTDKYCGSSNQINVKHKDESCK